MDRLTVVSHVLLAFNSSVNLLLYCICDRHFLVIAQKTLKMWFVYPLTLRREFAGSSESVTLKENTTVVVKTGEKNVTQGELNNAINRLGVFLFLRQTGEKVFADLQETYWMIGIALIGACLLSFIWIILMRFITRVMVWGSILIVFL